MQQQVERSGTQRGAKQRAFTLVEMLVVCGVIMLLAGLLIAAGADLRKQALIKETQTRIATLAAAVEDYYTEHRFYPYDAELNKLKGLDQSYEWLVGRTDAWGNAIQYRGAGTTLDGQPEPTRHTTTFDLWSFGPDGTDNNGGNDDINNWTRY